jgi:hypothetical protein
LCRVGTTVDTSDVHPADAFMGMYLS